MAFGKKNVIKIDPLFYNIGLLGEGGIGKTTIIKEMCEKLAGPDGYLFAECGKEDGADAISGINYVNCPAWSMDYDEYNNAVGFSDLIEDIIDNKNLEYPNLRTLIVDSYDQLRAVAVKEVVRRHNKKFPEKRVDTIKAAFGGYFAGDDMADEIILDALWSLKQVGVHFIIIGHTKMKDVTAVTGETYTQLTTDMMTRSFNIMKDKLHFLGVAHIDREIVKEVSRNKKEKDKSVVKSETRKITFRDDNYSIDSKSRFANIIEEIPFEVDALIDAITNAIKAEAEKDGSDVSKLKKEQDKKDKEHEKEIAKIEEQRRAEKEAQQELQDVIDQIQTYFNDNKDNIEVLKPIAAAIKEMGYKNPSMISDIEDAKAILDMCK